MDFPFATKNWAKLVQFRVNQIRDYRQAAHMSPKDPEDPLPPDQPISEHITKLLIEIRVLEAEQGGYQIWTETQAKNCKDAYFLRDAFEALGLALKEKITNPVCRTQYSSELHTRLRIVQIHHVFYQQLAEQEITILLT